MELFRDKITNLKFQLNIEGNNETPIVRFVIPLKDNLNFSVDAVVDYKGNSAKVIIPPLKSVITEGHIDSKTKVYLEVMVDDGYFIPWLDDLDVKESLRITANIEHIVDSDLSEKESTIETINISAALENNNPEETKIEKEEEIVEKVEEEKVEEKIETSISTKKEEVSNLDFSHSGMSAKDYINKIIKGGD